MYYVYLIRNEKKEVYIGYTTDLWKRLEDHNKGNTVSTRGHQWELIYYEAYKYEAYKAEEDARRREKSLKRSGAARKYLIERVKSSMNQPL